MSQELYFDVQCFILRDIRHGLWFRGTVMRFAFPSLIMHNVSKH